MSFTVRRLGDADITAFRAVRLEGLTLEPTAFASSLAEDAAIADAEWQARLARNSTFGVFEGAELVGTATFTVEAGAKTAHRGHLVGVYLRPGARGTGAAQLLLEAVLDAARHKVRFLYLIVNDANHRAKRFYERFGFTVFGQDPGGLMVDGTLYQDCLMMLRLTEGSGK